MVKTVNKFKINDLITIKLKDDNKTYIYLKKFKFRQCKKIVLSIPKKKFKCLESIKSIDEIIEVGDTSDKINISPEEEFWAHCSNIQAWVENNYDTSILESKMSFPLLKRLIIYGDLKAKRVFKEEIIKRIETEHIPSISYLIRENYLDFFSSEEIELIINNLNLEKIVGKNPEKTIHIIKRLVDYGNNKAIKFLKDLIIKGIKNQNVFFIEYYYNCAKTYFNEDELVCSLLDKRESEIILKIQNYLSEKFVIREKLCKDGLELIIKDGKIHIISISENSVDKIPKKILESIKSLII